MLARLEVLCSLVAMLLIALSIFAFRRVSEPRLRTARERAAFALAMLFLGLSSVLTSFSMPAQLKAFCLGVGIFMAAAAIFELARSFRGLRRAAS